MPIYRGSQKVTKLYRGTREILAAYRGGQKVYSSRQPINLTLLLPAQTAPSDRVLSPSITIPGTLGDDPIPCRWRLVINWQNPAYIWRRQATILRDGVQMFGFETHSSAGQFVIEHGYGSGSYPNPLPAYPGSTIAVQLSGTQSGSSNLKILASSLTIQEV